MKRSRFSEERIMVILIEQEAGADVGPMPTARGQQRDHCKLKAKLGGLEASDAKRLWQSRTSAQS